VNEPLKQRLVGALILVALGVIFWPIIFVQPTEQPEQDMPAIPPRPVVGEEPVPAPQLDNLRQSRPIAAAQAPEPVQPVRDDVVIPDVADTPRAKQSAPVVRREEAPEPLAIDEDGVPLAWILQVVTVSSADKADEIRGRLQAMDHKAYVKKVVRNGDTLYRVYVGPKFERAKLEQLQSDIDSAFGVSSIVVRYLP
jgi:DedD protein